MADDEHLALLQQGPEAWQAWRTSHPALRPDLSGADLGSANVSGISFRDADLRDSDLKDVEGLLVGQLGGADLTHAKLPGDIAPFDGLDYVRETSQHARNIFVSTLLACVYSWLTIATTTDARLLTNSASSPLPIINTEIPIAGFYWIAPVILLCFYSYLHFYLLRLWSALAGLPAVFPDGKPLHEKAYPWLLNGLVQAQFARLRASRTPVMLVENVVTGFLAIWLVPVTIFVFWLRYLPRHDWQGTALQVGFYVVAVLAALAVDHTAKRTLRGRRPTARIGMNRFLNFAAFRLVALLISIGVLCALSYGMLTGIQNTDTKIDDEPPWASRFFNSIGYSPNANLREAEVSTRPDNWWTAPEELTVIKGASLKGRNLQFADAVGAFLAKADLRATDLRRANLGTVEQDFDEKIAGTRDRRADLQLGGADLRGADLRDANLQAANLREANLRGADLRKTNLSNAVLIDADLRDTALEEVNFDHAILLDADLRNAIGIGNFSNAELTGADLRGAVIRGAPFSNADLTEVNLSGADMRDSFFAGADFSDAATRGTILDGADLREVKNLTKSQIQTACVKDPESQPELPKKFSAITVRTCTNRK